MITFEEDTPQLPQALNPEDLLLNLEGYEGPIDLLLTLARDQKVDLAKICKKKNVDYVVLGPTTKSSHGKKEPFEIFAWHGKLLILNSSNRFVK